MIRDRDLNLVLLRASLGTSAQHDPALARLQFSLPSGPLRPLLPSHTAPTSPTSQSAPSTSGQGFDLFVSHLLGTPLNLMYNVIWPLDLFLHPTELNAYTGLYSYLSALRKTHMRVHNCWTSLSNAQRARRRWTGLGEGGTTEDLELRSKCLRCGWGVVRDMEWFLDTLLGYLMTDVIDVEFRKLKELLVQKVPAAVDTLPEARLSAAATPKPLDFTTLRAIHATYIDRLLTGCLLTNTTLMCILRPILDICEQFVAQVERWGGDVLPALLFEGSLNGGDEKVGAMVKERWLMVSEINQVGFASHTYKHSFRWLTSCRLSKKLWTLFLSNSPCRFRSSRLRLLQMPPSLSL